jgi:UPF0271 protein
MKTIDLNCDMGEISDAIADGTQERLMPYFTSVNIACGGHAGDAQTMVATIEQALRCDVAVGAHPGYPDRANFGRVELDLPPSAVADFVFQQVHTLAGVAAACRCEVAHIKPHGALYNQAVHDRAIATAIAQGVARWNKNVILVGLAGSPMLEVFQKCGFRVAGEAFADRRYEPDGTLRSRKHADALIHDPAEASRQVLDLVERGVVKACDGASVPMNAQTICVHSDTPGAAQIAAAIREKLSQAGITPRSLMG